MVKRKCIMLVTAAINILAMLSLLLPIIKYDVLFGDFIISGYELIFGLRNGTLNFIANSFALEKYTRMRIFFLIIPSGLMLLALVVRAIAYKKRAGYIIALLTVFLAMGELIFVTLKSNLSICEGTIVFSVLCLVAMCFDIISIILKRKEGKSNSARTFDKAEDMEKKAAEHYIKGVEGCYAGAVIKLMAEPLVIGRDSSVCSLVIAGEKISRVHCRLWLDEKTNQVIIRDTSTNGVYYPDGERLIANKDIRLESNTTIFIGNSSNSFMIL